jgi:hypothetical protein
MGGHPVHASDALGDTIFSYEQIIRRELSVRCEDGYAHLLNWNFQNILVQISRGTLIRLLGSTYYYADLQREKCHDQVSKKAEQSRGADRVRW